MSDVTSLHEMPHSLGYTPTDSAVQTRERMRALIHAEVEKLHPTDDARRALELIIESALRPSEVDGELRLTVIDANGQPRMVDRNGKQVPFTLQDLLVELRSAHPVLFKAPPRPKAGAGDPAASQETRQLQEPLKRDWLTLDTAHASPSGRSAPPLSARAAARWRKGKTQFHAWSGRMSGKLRPASRFGDNSAIANVRKSMSDSRERAQALIETLQDKPLSRRPGFALSVVGGALLLAGVIAFFLLRADDTTQASADGPSETGAIASEAASAQAPANHSSGGRTLEGVPDVIDTATLSLKGEVVRLFGVEWAPGAGKPEDLTRYLQGREVTCEPASGNETYRCRVGGQDLSRVVLYNGGGQPTADATPELKAAADKAREAKLGVWNKQP